MYYNKVILIGRLVREPENIMLPSGSQISNLVIAYNRSYKDQMGQWKEESHFFEIKVFGRLAERIIPQLGKGDLVLIEGRLHQDKWLDKESGEPRSKIRIVAFDIKLLSKAGVAKSSNLSSDLEDLELPSFNEEDLLPPNEEKKSSEDLSNSLKDFILGEDETNSSNKKPETKKDDLDNLEDLLF